MAKATRIKKRGYIGKFLNRADKALDAGLKEANIAIAQGIKKADELLDYGIEHGQITATQAQKEAQKLKRQAEKEAERLRKEAKTETRHLRKQAEREGRRISKGGRKKIQDSVAAARKLASNRQENLRMLEKLGRLKKSGIITDKEFRAKKKELLKRI